MLAGCFGCQKGTGGRCEIRHAERVSIEYGRLGDVVEDKRWLVGWGWFDPGGAASLRPVL